MDVRNLKVGQVVTVIFSVGPAHPIHNVPTRAIITRIGGYNGRCVECTTVEPVHHPEDPEGISVFDKDWNFLHFKTRPAFDEVWCGWIDSIV